MNSLAMLVSFLRFLLWFDFIYFYLFIRSPTGNTPLTGDVG